MARRCVERVCLVISLIPHRATANSLRVLSRLGVLAMMASTVFGRS